MGERLGADDARRGIRAGVKQLVQEANLKHPTIQTRDQSGAPNGYLVPIWNVIDKWPEGYRPDQVYITAIMSGCRKGPHLHMKRRGLFTCIRGEVEIITRDVGGGYHREVSGPGYGYATVPVPAGTPCELRNVGTGTALVLNMPSPAWTAEEPDEWPVNDWNPDGE